MSLPLSWLPRNQSAQRIFLKSAAAITVSSALLLFTACGSIAAPATHNSATSPALTLSATLPSGTMGSTYNAVIGVSGGTPPYAFSLASGQLPTGVLLGNSTGALSGTPSETGTFNFSILVSDSKDQSQQASLEITVASAPQQGKSFSNLQSSAGWHQDGQGPPDFVDCNPCGPQITFSLDQGIGSPSMSGSSTQFNIGGTGPYWDVLFYNPLIGAYSSQGMPDSNHTIVPSLHNFTYDVYFYGTNLELAQALEFDINQFFDNLSFIWGTQCRVAGGNGWDIWDNVNHHWVHTGIACYPNSNAWNHLTLQMQRTSDNRLLYQSITLNGVTHTLNQYYDPGSAPGWYGVTINYQMDGNNKQSPYSVYLDDLTFSYQ